MGPPELAETIRGTIIYEVENNPYKTTYREPLVGFLAADDPGFAQLSEWTSIDHLQPDEMLPGARSVICFFLPFAPEIAYVNQEEKVRVAREWAVAYQETNALIGEITNRLIEVLRKRGIRAAAQPATGNFNDQELRSRWSHKSMAVLAGLGSFGLHQLVITDAGCAGRIGSLVIDAEVPTEKPTAKERCAYYAGDDCLDCVLACPVQALSEDHPIDRRVCWKQCLQNSKDFLDLGDQVKMCGKCAVMGPCALESAV